MRIRAIKPRFFKNEDLDELEQRTGLPVCLAFIGLWCAADREGRFVWRPKALKSDILPYRPVDFEKVLDALASIGVIEKYHVNGQAYGWIPSFLKHQKPHHKEAPSELPPPPNLLEHNDLIKHDSSMAQAWPKHDASCPTVLTGMGICDNRNGDNGVSAASKDASPRRRTLRDDLFDALLAVDGSDPKSASKKAKRACGVALAEIEEACRNAGIDLTVQEIKDRGRALRHIFRDNLSAITPSSLAKNWAKCEVVLLDSSRNFQEYQPTRHRFYEPDSN